MKRALYPVLALAQLALASGCGKPSAVVRVNSSDPDVFMTIETNEAAGPAAADFTRIYAHLVLGGKSDRELVLDGQYLQNTKVLWVDPHEVELCVSDGYTETFRNYVTLRVGRVSHLVHTRLRERCGPGRASGPGRAHRGAADAGRARGFQG